MPEVKNRMAGFMNQSRSKTEAPAPTPKPVEVAATEAPKRRAGRPKKETKAEVQPTTIRLDTDDHLAVRTLALRDKMPMNILIFTALKEYCNKRGVKLHGAAK